jgi:hypothetical protein
MWNRQRFPNTAAILMIAGLGIAISLARNLSGPFTEPGIRAPIATSSCGWTVAAKSSRQVSISPTTRSACRSSGASPTNGPTLGIASFVAFPFRVRPSAACLTGPEMSRLGD